VSRLLDPNFRDVRYILTVIVSIITQSTSSIIPCPSSNPIKMHPKSPVHNHTIISPYNRKPMQTTSLPLKPLTIPHLTSTPSLPSPPLHPPPLPPPSPPPPRQLFSQHPILLLRPPNPQIPLPHQTLKPQLLLLKLMMKIAP